jgi:RimJ/RimL family protein N-acetyltransferase
VVQYQATTLFIVTEAANLPSLRLAKRLGFTPAPTEVSTNRQSGSTEVVLWLPASVSEA